MAIIRFGGIDIILLKLRNYCGAFLLQEPIKGYLKISASLVEPDTDAERLLRQVQAW